MFCRTGRREDRRTRRRNQTTYRRTTMKQLLRSFLLSLSFALIAASLARADVKLPALISDGMVLQQGMHGSLWGCADEGQSDAAELERQTVAATAKDGKWMVRLKPLKAGGPFTLTISGKNKIELKNVLVGEVWICGGQSNMQWQLR